MTGWGQTSGRAAIALALLCALPAPVHADVRIEGDEAALRVVAEQTTLADVLAALQDRFGLRYDASAALNRPVNGTMSGTLHRVVVRLLDGYDFVVKRSPDGIEIMQIAARGQANVQRLGRAGAPQWRSSITQASAQMPR